LRAGATFTALLTAGENGEAIVGIVGGCTMAFSVAGAVGAGVTALLLAALAKSSFEGISAGVSTSGGHAMDFGDGSDGVEADQGGAGG